MMRFPWGSREDDESDQAADEPGGETDEDSQPHRDIEPVISCEFQDGTLFVFDDQLFIERSKGSKFSDKWIALDQVRDVRYAKRFVISYIQIEQVGFDNSEGGIISSPVDENTLHLGHGKRECARRARDAILERLPQ